MQALHQLYLTPQQTCKSRSKCNPCAKRLANHNRGLKYIYIYIYISCLRVKDMVLYNNTIIRWKDLVRNKNGFNYGMTSLMKEPFGKHMNHVALLSETPPTAHSQSWGCFLPVKPSENPSSFTSLSEDCLCKSEANPQSPGHESRFILMFSAPCKGILPCWIWTGCHISALQWGKGSF